MATKQKPYRKPHVTMNRKKYGYVKPTKKLKKVVTRPKPQVLELKRIFAKLKKAASWQKLAIMAEAIQWYRNTFQYIQEVVEVKGLSYSTVAAKALQAFHTAHFTMAATAKAEADKTAAGVQALNFAQQFCIANGVKAPSVKPYMQKHKLVAKKLDALVERASAKYDKLLTLLLAATDSPYDLKIAPRMLEPIKIDNALKTIFFSTDEVKRMSEMLRTRGLLPLVVDKGHIIARAMSYTQLGDGTFIPDKDKQFLDYQLILARFCRWATTAEAAPKNVLRRPKKKG